MIECAHTNLNNIFYDTLKLCVTVCYFYTTTCSYVSMLDTWKL